MALASSDKDAIAQLQVVAESDSPYRERAVQIASRRPESSAAKMWQRKMSQNPKQIRLAIIGAGALGDPEAVPSLIERMKNPLAMIKVTKPRSASCIEPAAMLDIVQNTPVAPI